MTDICTPSRRCGSRASEQASVHNPYPIPEWEVPNASERASIVARALATDPSSDTPIPNSVRARSTDAATVRVTVRYARAEGTVLDSSFWNFML